MRCAPKHAHPAAKAATILTGSARSQRCTAAPSKSQTSFPSPNEYVTQSGALRDRRRRAIRICWQAALTNAQASKVTSTGSHDCSTANRIKRMHAVRTRPNEALMRRLLHLRRLTSKRGQRIARDEIPCTKRIKLDPRTERASAVPQKRAPRSTTCREDGGQVAKYFQILRWRARLWREQALENCAMQFEAPRFL